MSRVTTLRVCVCAHACFVVKTEECLLWLKVSTDLEEDPGPPLDGLCLTSLVSTAGLPPVLPDFPAFPGSGSWFGFVAFERLFSDHTPG